MDPDLNKYDLENVTVAHPKMSARGMAADLSRRVGLVLLRRARRAHDEAQHRLRHQAGADLCARVLQIYGALNFEKRASAAMRLFPAARTARSAGPSCRACRRSCSIRATLGDAGQIRSFRRLRAGRSTACASAWRRTRRPKRYTRLRHHAGRRCGDRAPEMFELNHSSRAAVEKARKQAEQRRLRERKTPMHHHEEPVHIEAAE